MGGNSLIRDGIVEGMETQGRRPCEDRANTKVKTKDRGRDWSDVATN